jgi:hypothetical protein
MARIPIAFAATLAFAQFVSANLAIADDAPPAIREFDVPTVERLGQEMYDQDQLAWKATDIAVAHFTADGMKAQKAQGWIVVPSDDGGNIVRFIRETDGGPQSYYDVKFAKDGSWTASVPDAAPLSATEAAQFGARQLALGSVAQRCSDRYNPIVLKDPQGDGWLAWAIAATDDPGVAVIGGHYRVMISADGKTIIRSDRLSNGCLTLPKPDNKEGYKLAGLYTSEIVSLAPLETYVFASLSYKLRVVVGTNDGNMWKYDGDVVSNITMDTPGSDGSEARAIAGVSEICKVIATKNGESPPKYYLTDGIKVIAATEKDEPFVLTVSDGFAPIGVVCSRKDIVPAPNDYKVLQTGYTLSIGDRGTGHPSRLGDLELVDGHPHFKLVNGPPLSDDLQDRVNKRLDAFQNALQTKH